MRFLPVAVLCSVSALIPVLVWGQDAAALERAFSGKEVVLKLDMPGSQKGVDLRLDKNVPMDWKEYGKRTKEFGVAIRKGDSVRITAVVVKRDMIEVQLGGGGFGTFTDDSRTTVDATRVEKSRYEKQLESDLANETDEDKRRQLQRDLDRERTRRDREQSTNDREARRASADKADRVADQRMTGGSRFNIRWGRTIPVEEMTPEYVEKELAEFVEFPES